MSAPQPAPGSRLVLLCLVAALAALPLVFYKPGLPLTLRAAEADYLLMASSLAFDGDLRFTPADIERLKAQFPYTESYGVDLVSDDGFTSADFGRAAIYPLLAAPWVRLFGSNGLLSLHALLFLAAIWIGARRLRRGLDEGPALLASATYFFLSLAFTYVFQMRPEILCLTAVAAALALGWRRRAAEPAGGPWVASFASGACLAIAAQIQWTLLWLALPLLVSQGLGKEKRRIGAWIAGFGLVLALSAAATWSLTGRPAGSWAAESLRVTVENPVTFSLPEAVEEARLEADRPRPPGPLRRATYFLAGRYTGLLPYFPLGLAACLLFLFELRQARGGVSRRRLVLAGAVLAAALTGPSLGARQSWDLVGRPELLGLYPAALFLVGRWRPLAVPIGGLVLACLFLGPLTFSVLGASIPGTSSGAHTRGLPYSPLPLELDWIDRLPGFQATTAGDGTRIWARAEDVHLFDGSLFFQGTQRGVAWLDRSEPLTAALANIRSYAPDNRIRLRIGWRPHRLRLGKEAPDHMVQLRLRPWGGRRKLRSVGGQTRYLYPLVVSPKRVGQALWLAEQMVQRYFVGASVTVLGSEDFVLRDLYQVEWQGCQAPAEAAAGDDLLALARLTNASPHPWPAAGGGRVRLSYRWLTLEGEPVPGEAALRTDFEGDVEPGETVRNWLRVETPEAPGDYLLEIDPIFELVAWFSQRNGGQTCRQQVSVRPPDQ